MKPCYLIDNKNILFDKNIDMKEKFNLKKMFNLIAKEMYPNGYKCLLCHEELSTNTLYSVCDKCMLLLPFNNGHTCTKCSEPIGGMGNLCIHCKNQLPLYKKNTSIFIYKDAIVSMVRRLKFDNAKYLSITLGNFIASEVVKMNVDFDVVIPVPLYEARQKKRGYNQSELLCSTLKDKLHMNVDTNILFKIRDTRSQHNLSRNERIENLEGAFEVKDKKLIKGKIVLLVDDVFTTGTTINECTKTLLELGAKEVYSITLAHANTKVLF